MRKSLVLATILVLVCSAVVLAGVPDPTRSGTALQSPPALCQWRFNAAAGLDHMTLSVTLRDGFDVPVVGCSTSATLGSPSLVVQQCGGLTKSASTDSAGVALFAFTCIGGRGDATIYVTAHCSGDIAINPAGDTFTFTSPDMNGSGEATNSTTIVDLGLWAAGLASPNLPSDFNCSGGVANIVDLAQWASGLGKGCNNCP
jgi:hypothetical protein